MANKWKLQLTTKQKMFVDADQDEVLFGGAAGGGKSYVQNIDSVLKAQKYPGSKQLILRRSFPELERSLIRTFLEVVPKELYNYNSSKHLVTFKNKSTLEFGFCEDEKDVYKYQSAEYDFIRLDEATHFTEYQFLYLKSRLRGANSYPKQMKCSSNPGNVGHQFIRGRFIDPAPPMTTYEVPTTNAKRKPQTRIFIPCKVTENKFLMEADEDYISRLEDLPENERKALLEGDWYTFEGQFFPEFNYNIHVVHELPTINNVTRIYSTMDYGLDMCATYFVAVENGKATVFGEIYEPNLIISEAAKRLKAKQQELGIKKVDQYLAPSDLWNRRQETGKSVADIFRQNGIMLSRTSRDRVDGWAATKEWLKVFQDEQEIKTSNLKIHEGCVNLIRTLQAIQYDERRPNDCAVNPHELTHAPDALRGFCVYWARGNKEKVPLDERYLAEERDIERFNSPEMYDVYGGNEDASGNNLDYWGS